MLCSYQPETLTVRAGISLPTGGRGQAQIAAPYEEDNALGRRGRMGRVLQKPEALGKNLLEGTYNVCKNLEPKRFSSINYK